MRRTTYAILLFMISFYNLSAQNALSANLDITTAPTEEITINETKIGLTFSTNIDTKNKLTNTLEYKNIGVKYRLGNYDLPNNLHRYNSIENTIEYSHRLTKKTTVVLEIKPTAYFENNLNAEDLSLFGGLEISYTINSSNNFLIGVKRAQFFGKPEILPTFSFHHQIAENAFVKIGFPNSTISYSNNSRNAFRFTNDFTGSYYNLDQNKVLTDNSNATKVSFSKITSALEYERNMDTNWFVNLKAGYDFNKKHNLRDHNGDTKYDFNISNGYIFNIGIKYKH